MEPQVCFWFGSWKKKKIGSDFDPNFGDESILELVVNLTTIK
jgi:hypothetical protein